MVYAGRENQKIADRDKITCGDADAGTCPGLLPLLNGQNEGSPKTYRAYTKYDKCQISLPLGLY